MGSDGLPVGVWGCLGEIALEFLVELCDGTMGGGGVGGCRRCVGQRSGTSFQERGWHEGCGGMNLIGCAVIVWEGIVEGRSRSGLAFVERQYIVCFDGVDGEVLVGV